LIDSNTFKGKNEITFLCVKHGFWHGNRVFSSDINHNPFYFLLTKCSFTNILLVLLSATCCFSKPLRVREKLRNPLNLSTGAVLSWFYEFKKTAVFIPAQSGISTADACTTPCRILI